MRVAIHRRLGSMRRVESLLSFAPQKLDEGKEEREEKIYSIFHVATEANKRRRLFLPPPMRFSFLPFCRWLMRDKCARFEEDFFPSLAYVMAARNFLRFPSSDVSISIVVCGFCQDFSFVNKTSERGGKLIWN
jgi:hypothetical protein